MNAKGLCSSILLLLAGAVALAAASDPQAEPSLELRLEPAAAQSLPAAEVPSGKTVDVCAVEAGAIAIDGDLADWADCPSVFIGGDADCGGSFRVAVSPTDWYLAVEVTDATIVQDMEGADIWRNDSVQFALDGDATRTANRFDDGDFEYGLARVKGQPLVYRWQAPPGRDTGVAAKAELACVTVAGGLVYELRLPLAELEPMVPMPVITPGFTILINDSDTGERDGYVEWTPGIAESKNPAAFGVLRFPETAEVAGDRVVVQADLQGIFADEEEDYRVRCGFVTARPLEGTIRVTIRDRGEEVLSDKVSYAAEAGMSWQVLHVAVRNHPPAKLELQVDVLEQGKEEPLFTSRRAIYKYNSALVR